MTGDRSEVPAGEVPAGEVTAGEVALLGLDALEVTLASSSLQEGVANARSLLFGLDADVLLRVCGWFAWQLAVTSRKARGEGLARWLELHRLEAGAQVQGLGDSPVWSTRTDVEPQAIGPRQREAVAARARRRARAHVHAVVLLGEAASELVLADAETAVAARLRGLGSRDLVELVVALAVEAVWELPPGAFGLVSEARRDRFRVVRRWCQRRCREAGAWS